MSRGFVEVNVGVGDGKKLSRVKVLRKPPGHSQLRLLPIQYLNQMHSPLSEFRSSSSTEEAARARTSAEQYA
jgi:hypothetical protein